MTHLAFDRESADAFIEDHFGEREIAAFRLCAVPAMQADYFRLCAMHVIGGIWCDADSRCEASVEGLLRADGVELFRFPGDWVSNGYIVAGSSRHPLFELALGVATVSIEDRVADRVDLVTGPMILTTLVESWRHGSFGDWLAVAPDPLPAFVSENRNYREFLQGISKADLASAMRGVRVSPSGKLDRFMTHYLRLPYKRTGSYHGRFEGSIYTTPAGG